MILPSPLHCGHSTADCEMPNRVCCWRSTVPEPPQVGHVENAVPSFGSGAVTVGVFDKSRNLERLGDSGRYFGESHLDLYAQVGTAALAAGPSPAVSKPPMLPKPPPKMSPNCEKMSSIENPPAWKPPPPGKPCGPILWPNWSYLARFSGLRAHHRPRQLRFELLLGFLVAGILVRVILDGLLR